VWEAGKALELDALMQEHATALTAAISSFTYRAIGDLKTMVAPIQNDLKVRNTYIIQFYLFIIIDVNSFELRNITTMGN
jgi:hypothetical protein